MADYRVFETLQALTSHTIKAVMQAASIQAVATEIHQQGLNLRAPGNKTDNSAQAMNTSTANSSTTVELSPAAKFPPLLEVAALASLQTRRPDAVRASFVDLSTLKDDEKNHAPAEKIRHTLVLANQLSQASLNAEESSAPQQHNASTLQNAYPSAYSSTLQNASALSTEHALARMEIGVFEETQNQTLHEPRNYRASLQLQLAQLGTVIIQLTLNESQTDIAIHAPPNSLKTLEAQQTGLKNAAQAWGLKLNTLVYSPLSLESEKP